MLHIRNKALQYIFIYIVSWNIKYIGLDHGDIRFNYGKVVLGKPLLIGKGLSYVLLRNTCIFQKINAQDQLFCFHK